MAKPRTTILATLCASALVSPGSARAGLPEMRLWNVWLEIQLVGLFYAESTPETYPSDLAAVARQLGHPAPVVRAVDLPTDVRKYRVGTVLVDRDPPPETLILYTRSVLGGIWELKDGPSGPIRVFGVLPSG